MKCLIWRQHRGQLLWTAALLVVAAAAIAVVTRTADRWLAGYTRWQAQLHAAGCAIPGPGTSVIHTPSSTCRGLLARYPDGEQSSFVHSYNFTIAVFEEGLPLVMVIVGVLIGAPLVAREVEQRTHLVAWTQSVSRGRWYAIKASVLAGAVAIAGLLAGLANDRVQIPLNRGGLTSSRWIWFFSIDLAPAAEGALAFALAAAIGAYLRRTLVTIAVALVGFLGLFVLTGWVVRSLTPAASEGTNGRGTPDNAWKIGGGQYHPASQYWPLQLTYLAILLALAAALLALGWRATRPRRTV